MELTEQEVKTLIDEVGDCIDSFYDYTQSPIFPENRNDVCAVVRTTENGISYGYDTLYLVWKSGRSIRYKEIKKTQEDKASIIIKSVKMTNNVVILKFLVGGGGRKGSPTMMTKKVKI